LSTTPALPLTIHRMGRNFFIRPTLNVARDLLGKYLVHETNKYRLVGKIVEVEAYLGERDPASHSYRGKTKRNEVMFRSGGYLYVYFTYGMHFCCNVVTGREGIGRAVLLRAVEPIEGKQWIRARRAKSPTEVDLCNGPAKLCQAFGIDRRDNGTDLCGKIIWIGATASDGKKFAIGSSTRIGISNGRKHRWRFFIQGNPFVSRGKPAK